MKAIMPLETINDGVNDVAKTTEFNEAKEPVDNSVKVFSALSALFVVLAGYFAYSYLTQVVPARDLAHCARVYSKDANRTLFEPINLVSRTLMSYRHCSSKAAANTTISDDIADAVSVHSEKTVLLSEQQLSIVGMLIISAVIGVTLESARSFLVKPVLTSLATAAVVPKPCWSAAETNIRRGKWEDSAYSCVYHCIITSLGWYILVDKAWVSAAIVPFAHGDAKSMCFHDIYRYTTPADIQIYYVLALAHAMQSAYRQMTLRRDRKDFFQMISHDFLTACLLIFSYAFYYTRIGSLVLFVHDICDIPIGASRCFNDARMTRCTLVGFIGLLVTWIYFRLWVFPMYIIWDAATIGGYNGGNLLCIPFIIMMLGLMVLHVFWFYMFMKMGYNVVAKNIVDDNVDDISQRNDKVQLWCKKER